MPSEDARVRRYDNASCCKDTYWYLWFEVKHQDYKEYKMDHSGSYWTSWSGWSDTPYKASSTRKVEKRTVYRYRHGDGSCTKDDWEEIDGSWYHFDVNGWMQTGWIYLNGYWYYLYSDGHMAVDTTIDGCYVDSSGCWISNHIYINLLQELVRDYGYGADKLTYGIYDMDKDGVDELIFRYVNWNNYMNPDTYWGYTIRNGQTVYLGEIDAYTASIYTCPKQGFYRKSGDVSLFFDYVYYSNGEFKVERVYTDNSYLWDNPSFIKRGKKILFVNATDYSLIQ